MSDKELNFEKELNRLKEIVSLIQQKDLSLDKSIELYEEGAKIVKELNAALAEADKKVEQVIEVK